MSKLYNYIKSKFTLFVEQLFTSVSSVNMVREVMNVSPNFKRVACYKKFLLV